MQKHQKVYINLSFRGLHRLGQEVALPERVGKDLKELHPGRDFLDPASVQHTKCSVAYGLTRVGGAHRRSEQDNGKMRLSHGPDWSTDARSTASAVTIGARIGVYPTHFSPTKTSAG